MDSGVDFSDLLVSSDDKTENSAEAGSANVSRRNSTSKRTVSTTSLKIEAKEDEKREPVEEKVEKAHDLEISSKGKIKGSLFLHYINSAEMPIGAFVLVVLFLFAQILASGADYWVAYW